MAGLLETEEPWTSKLYKTKRTGHALFQVFSKQSLHMYSGGQTGHVGLVVSRDRTCWLSRDFSCQQLRQPYLQWALMYSVFIHLHCPISLNLIKMKLRMYGQSGAQTPHWLHLQEAVIKSRQQATLLAGWLKFSPAESAACSLLTWLLFRM